MQLQINPVTGVLKTKVMKTKKVMHDFKVTDYEFKNVHKIIELTFLLKTFMIEFKKFKLLKII